MLTDERNLDAGFDAATQDAAMREYVASAARDLNGRFPQLALVEQQQRREDHERAAELEHARAMQARAVCRQMRAERRAGMTPRQRLLDSLGELLRLHLGWLAALVALVAGGVLAAGLADDARALAECGGVLIIVLGLSRHVVERRRDRQIPDGYNDRVSDQLDRVKAAIPAGTSGSTLQPYWS
jgi:hypothetical protein